MWSYLELGIFVILFIFDRKNSTWECSKTQKWKYFWNAIKVTKDITKIIFHDINKHLWRCYLDFKLIDQFKVVPRIKKTKVFRKGWNFANRTYFASCIMRKHYFLLWTKETALFPYFYHGIIFYSAELFDYAVSFKFYLNIFMFLNINTNLWRTFSAKTF